MLEHLGRRTPFILGLFLVIFGIVISEEFQLYTRFSHFDKVLHVAGGLVIAWFALAVFREHITRLAPWEQLVVISGIVCLAGVFWELAEFGANSLRTSWPVVYHYFHGGNLADTLGDITADLVGGTLVVAWALWKERA